MTLHESRTVQLVIPEAPSPVMANAAPKARGARALRIGMLDNSKGNADHLLAMLGADLKREIGAEVALTLGKSSSAMGAPKEILDRLAREADFVVSAMAD